MGDVAHRYLCIHGHFYQPPREDPFTGRIPHEPGATPYDNFNERAAAQCYVPNVESGNFARISFDVGPTLASWLEHKHPEIYERIVGADRLARRHYGVGNALAHPYFHTILPLATARDKRTQIMWGLSDFATRFGHRAEGMWLAETAVDLETLDMLAEQGVRYTVLAPWQATGYIDPTEPYMVRLPSGRAIAVFFFNGRLSSAVSFDERATINADTFAREHLFAALNPDKDSRGQDQLIVVATDGELYGHHKPFRDQFLTHLTRQAAATCGFEVTSLGRYLAAHPPTRTVELSAPSAWSCRHGVNRWSAGCSCTEGETGWKPALRSAFEHLAERLDDIYERLTAETSLNLWGVRDSYIAFRERRTGVGAQQARRTPEPVRWCDHTVDEKTRQLLEAQYYGQGMFTSCGWYFEDLDRIEPRIDIALARKAISLVWQATGIDLQHDFLTDLAAAKSWRSVLTGADLYLQLPRTPPDLLPPLAHSDDTSAA